MIAWLLRRPAFAALAGLAALLVLVIGVETGFGTRLRPELPTGPTKVAAATEAKLLPPPAAVVPDQAYPETTARPLFTPTRRPAPVEPNAGKPAFTRGQFVLQGVIVVGEQRTALLREKSSGRVHRVDRGKDVNGITVERIDPAAVTLAMGGEREKLDLVVQRATPTATTAAAGAAGGGGANPSGEAAGPFGVSPVGRSPTTVAPAAPPAASNGPGAVSGLNAPTAAQPARPGTERVSPPSTQPMSPEELLARRRARRNQPTQ